MHSGADVTCLLDKSNRWKAIDTEFLVWLAKLLPLYIYNPI